MKSSFPCNNCDCLEFCDQIRRCLRAGIETDSIEGEVHDFEDDLNEEGGLKPERLKSPAHIDDRYRNFLTDVIFA